MPLRICDRCGETINVWEDQGNNKEQDLTLRYHYYSIIGNKKVSRGTNYNFCSKCYKELIEWLNAKVKEN